MKKIELILAQYRNFKGLEKTDIELDGKNATIYGTNASGKTTIFDGVTWLLFDKDSNNDAKFALQTIERATGEKMTGLQHGVKGVFSINGALVELMKVYKEVWQTAKGTNVKTFKGHTTEHYIDGVPVKKTEYVARIDSIVKEDIFKLLTSPSYFNEQLKWQDKRAILVEISGGVTDAEIFEDEEELKRFESILSDKSVEDMKKIIAAKKKKIDDKIKSIPIRIDEIYKGMPDLQIDTGAIKEAQAKLMQEIEELQAQKTNVKNGAAITKKRAALSELTNKISTEKQLFEAEYKQKGYELQAKLQECKSNLQILENNLAVEIANKHRYSDAVKGFAQQIEQIDSETAELRATFGAIRDEPFEYDSECQTCQTCGQALTPALLEEARAEAEAQFDFSQEKKLLAINEQGRDLKARREVLAERYTKGQEEVLNVAKRLEKTENNVNDAAKQFEKVKKALAAQKMPVFEESAAYEKLASKCAAIRAEIADLESNQTDVINDIDEAINALLIQKETADAELAKYAGIDASKARIAELEREQQALAAEYEQLEGELFLMDEHTRKKITLLEEKINAMFKYTTFKLFEEQVKGGFVETCIAMHNNIPYGKGLNSAAKIMVGLDVINTLSAYNKISAPIFVDNAESVVEFIDVQAQLIKLVVSEQDKQLRVVTH